MLQRGEPHAAIAMALCTPAGNWREQRSGSSLLPSKGGFTKTFHFYSDTGKPTSTNRQSVHLVLVHRLLPMIIRELINYLHPISRLLQVQH